MAFKKGETGNPTGRPKGAKNKIANASREFIEDAIAGVYPSPEEMAKDINRIKDPAFKVRVVAQLYEFITPKLARTDSTVKHEGAVPISINKTYKKE